MLKEGMAFLVAPGPYKGCTQSVYDVFEDRVMWSADRQPALGRNLTLEEYRRDTGIDWMVIDENDLVRLDAEFEETLVTDPTPITEETFLEMLGVLPPCRWSTIDGVEMFHISERFRGSLVAWYAHTQRGWFKCTDRASIDAQIIARKFARAAGAFPPVLSPDERNILSWLAQEETSPYGACACRSLDRLRSLGLATWCEPSEPQSPVSITEAGKAVIMCIGRA